MTKSLFDDATLAAARLCWPEMAEQERTAALRITNTLSGHASVEDGSKALADWIDARVALVTYYEVLPRV